MPIKYYSETNKTVTMYDAIICIGDISTIKFRLRYSLYSWIQKQFVVKLDCLKDYNHVMKRRRKENKKETRICAPNVTSLTITSKNIVYIHIYICIYYRADHEDQDVVLFNRVMLPAYYGLLRLCCQQSRTFTRQLAAHQNIQWAFKNITPHPTQYSTVRLCLYLFVQKSVSNYD